MSQALRCLGPATGNVFANSLVLLQGQSETPSGEAVLHFDPNKPETARVTEPLIPEGGEQLVDMAMLRSVCVFLFLFRLALS